MNVDPVKIIPVESIIQYPSISIVLKNKLFCFKLLCAILSFLPLSSLKAQLKADFSADIVSGCSPLVVQFKDLTTGGATQWKWDLGNGGSSTLQNPGSVYLDPGTYTIKLIAINENETDTVVKTGYITVYAKPEIDFSVNNSIGCLPLSTQFTDKSKPSSGDIVEWVWDFGDGKISTDRNPMHTYTVSNTFGVSLTVKNSFGCQQTLLKPDFITTHPSVSSGFNYNFIDACKWPLQVQFSDSSISKAPLKYQWLFGDGSGSQQSSPLHSFQQPGDYLVRLISSTEKGCADTVSQVISMNGAKPDFSFSPNTCINNPILFTNKSVPEPISVTWVFGVADSAFELNAVQSFSKPGIYPVKMIADFGNCTSEVIKNINILELPKPGFSVRGVQTCSIPATVQFTNQSAGAVSYKWLFGDGTSSTIANPSHIYQKAGSYHVSLIAINANGCADTIEQKNSVHVGPPKIQGLENLSVADCVPLKITPKAIINSPEKIASYYWDFGDGTYSTSELPSHEYTRTGIYNVKLKVLTASGCSDSFLVRNAVTVSEPATTKNIE